VPTNVGVIDGVNCRFIVPAVDPTAWPVPPDIVGDDGSPAGLLFNTIETFATVLDDVEKKLNETFAGIGEFTVPVPSLVVKEILTGATEIKFLNVNAKLLNETTLLGVRAVFA
jgi:hypothetical protein